MFLAGSKFCIFSPNSKSTQNYEIHIVVLCIDRFVIIFRYTKESIDWCGVLETAG